MKASDLKKKSIDIESIYKEIESMNSAGQFKHVIPHFIYVSDEVKLKLMADGFKVYIGNWSNFSPNDLIIEW